MNAFVPSDNPDAPLYVGSSLKWNFDKGTVDDRGEVISPCDSRFLIELNTRLDRGYDDIYQHFIIEDEDSAQSGGNEEFTFGALLPPESFVVMSDELCQVIHGTSILFVEIAREVRRLQRYPKLFPNESSMMTFHSVLLSKLSSNNEKWKNTTGVVHSESCWNRLEKSEYLIEFWLRHPTYQYDLKPWQQFMKDKAPGSGINPKVKFLNNVSVLSHFKDTESVKGNFHIMPPGGIAVWRDWVENFQDVRRRIHQTVIPDHFRTDITDRVNSEEMLHLRPMLYRCETLPFHFQLNLWNPRVCSHERVFPEDVLPTLETIIGDLEGFIDIGFEDTTASGMVVASKSNNEYLVFHHGNH
ncbi:hypothetical protein UA08_01943 [Talaromyces atroroseus]|uniref:Uncharacterized protein n=1 Tax=Talaromyces atroroseus TaxID=1441469 RepID=A0A1Q5QC64_TALAT|nr:hypothetical protein UA08_01943 [Talaromyces atroroseus]OKL63523.1 hypothetical protein UA08_01943 [Talaromyces atroroseus]